MCILHVNIWKHFSFFLKKPGGWNHVMLRQVSWWTHSLQCTLNSDFRGMEEHCSDCMIQPCTGRGAWDTQWKLSSSYFTVCHTTALRKDKSQAHYWNVFLWRNTTHEAEIRVCSHICFSKHNVWITCSAVYVELRSSCIKCVDFFPVLALYIIEFFWVFCVIYEYCIMYYILILNYNL